MKALQLLDISIAPDLHELTKHGTPIFPCAGYDEDPGKYLVGNIPWHWHEEIEIILSVEGDTLVLCDEAEFLLHEGEMIFVNTNVLHKLKRGQKGVPCRINSLLFAPEFISGFPQSFIQLRYFAPLVRCAQLSEVLLLPGVPWQAEAIAHFRRAFEAFISDRFGYEIIVQVELMYLLLVLLENQQDRICETALTQNKDAIRIKQMLGYIHEHYAEPLTLAFFADMCHVTKSYLSALFKKETGGNLTDYIHSVRIRHSLLLLNSTNPR